MPTVVAMAGALEARYFYAMTRLPGEGRAMKPSDIFPLVAIALLLSGCVQGPASRAPSGDAIDAARALSDAPAPVRTSDAKNSCRVFAVAQGHALPSAAVNCLKAAVSDNQPAQLAWSYPTTEGDPIVSFAFVEASSAQVTVYTTNAFDSYGGDPRWAQSTCSDPAIATSPMGCPTP